MLPMLTTRASGSIYQFHFGAFTVGKAQAGPGAASTAWGPKGQQKACTACSTTLD